MRVSGHLSLSQINSSKEIKEKILMDGMVKNKSMKQGKGNHKKLGLITKTWERCKSIGRGHKSSSSSSNYSSSSSTTLTATRRSKSWPSLVQLDEPEKRGGKKGSTTVVAPQGCFSVYVGPQMQRFVIKTEYANHPLFKMLLEEAESEYGYSSQGPLALPCNVDVFYKVLMEIEYSDEGTAAAAAQQTTRQGCANFGKRSRSPTYHLLSPSPMLSINNF